MDPNFINGQLIPFIIEPPSLTWLLVLKIVFIIISIAMVYLMGYFAVKSYWFRFMYLEDITEFFTYRPYGTKSLEKSWNKIKTRLETGLESEFKLAIIEADSMLDDVLKKLGYPGESLGERLKKISSAVIPNISEIYEAHQVRNNIVHDPDYKLFLDDAQKTLSAFERCFQDLQIF